MSRNSLSSALLLMGFPCPGMMMVLSVIAARLASDAAIMPSMPGWLAVRAGEHDAGEYLTTLAGRLWAQIGIACQKPLHRAVERDESLVRQWLKKEYPKIKAMAKKQGADIYFGDAAHIRSDHHAGRTWGAKGDTPIVQATGARHGMSLISAVTSRGHLRFMIIDKGSVNADVFIEFLKRLIKGAERKIFLIVDRGSAHRAKKVSAFVQTLGAKLYLFFLPPYAPDRNPDELVWKHLKADTVGRMAVTSKEDFARKVRRSMRDLQNDARKII